MRTFTLTGSTVRSRLEGLLYRDAGAGYPCEFHMAHLQGLDEAGLKAGLGLPGDLLEAFVHAALAKHQGWAGMRMRLMHYRTSTGVEVDFVLENRAGELVGIKVKAATTIGTRDFNGLRHLRETAPAQPAWPRRSDLERLGQARAVTRLHRPAGDRGGDG
ncbi:hypothetical protein DNJ95_18515 [Stutzerimonas kirkiae]|uniref:DUF4143 domain-containing protein n=1 Tax=Stutzerimonas kirkiae TaxID=2211392 RepID=A0A4Q9QYF3_9GAMM|nr:hypothetical protein DNJ96_17035 [Stutzerimonas kirkiae]TBU98219.1 hypothetical protein DNJ95_18515 [Stutzerimonas kirkiae]TBV10187.1 hypothetical protein DNK01_18190 [Stutzerimonas kirkiae]